MKKYFSKEERAGGGKIDTLYNEVVGRYTVCGEWALQEVKIKI